MIPLQQTVQKQEGERERGGVKPVEAREGAHWFTLQFCPRNFYGHSTIAIASRLQAHIVDNLVVEHAELGQELVKAHPLDDQGFSFIIEITERARGEGA